MSRAGDFRNLGLDPDLMTKFVKVKIPSAQVLTLRASPKTLVPAQGSNRLIQLVGGMLELNPGSVAYTESADNLIVRYTDANGIQVSQVVEMTAFITLTVRSFTSIQPKVDGIVAATGALNKPLVLHNNGDGEFGNAGTGSLTVWLAYRVWDVTP